MGTLPVEGSTEKKSHTLRNWFVMAAVLAALVAIYGLSTSRTGPVQQPEQAAAQSAPAPAASPAPVAPSPRSSDSARQDSAPPSGTQLMVLTTGPAGAAGGEFFYAANALTASNEKLVISCKAARADCARLKASSLYEFTVLAPFPEDSRGYHYPDGKPLTTLILSDGDVSVVYAVLP